MKVSNELIGRPMEILLVEDSPADAGLTMAALKDGGVRHRLSLTVNGLEAITFLRREGIFQHAPRPDLVLLDLGLPKKDGRELLAELRSDERLKSIPVVILTASAGDEDHLRSRLLGVDAYMVKPVNLAKFLEVVLQLRHRWMANVILPVAIDGEGRQVLTSQSSHRSLMMSAMK